MTIEEVCKEMRQSIQHWKDINQNGCNDPFWADGCNMNLVRNHIIYDKCQLENMCREKSCPLPEEYYFPTPPEVDNHYMANLKQKDRVKRLVQMGNVPVLRRYRYDEYQLSLF